ncbi:hypothetical protein Tco_0999579 [Tanacetum coccineum]
MTLMLLWSFCVHAMEFIVAAGVLKYVVPTGRVVATDSVIFATSGYVVPADYDISPGGDLILRRKENRSLINTLFLDEYPLQAPFEERQGTHEGRRERTHAWIFCLSEVPELECSSLALE